MTSKDELLQYRLFALALLALLIAFTWFSFTATGTDAAPAPTATPAPMVTDGHCALLEDGDTCYILTQPGCNWTMTRFGPDSMGVELECDPVRGEGVDVRLKDGQ